VASNAERFYLNCFHKSFENTFEEVYDREIFGSDEEKKNINEK
jgi:hypothetical protein